MQVTIDIPEQTFQELEAIASARNLPLETVINDKLRKAVGAPLSSEELARRFPVIQSKYPNSITSEQVAEFDLFDPS